MTESTSDKPHDGREAPKPRGEIGRPELAEAAKTGGVFGVSEILLQTADAISMGVATEVDHHPFLIRLSLVVVLRLTVALVEERGSLVAGARFFWAWFRARYRDWMSD